MSWLSAMGYWILKGESVGWGKKDFVIFNFFSDNGLVVERGRCTKSYREYR